MKARLVAAVVVVVVICLSLLTTAGLLACAGSPTPSATSSPAPGPSSTPTRAEVAQAVKDLVAQRDPGYPISSVSEVRLAQDASGRWWAWAAARHPASELLETPIVIICKAGDTWKLVSYGTDPAITRVPKEIRNALWPGSNPASQ